MTRRKHRDRYLRAFLAWLADQRSTLGVRLLHMHTRKHYLIYQIEGYGGLLELCVRRGDISVAAMRNGEVWDLLYCLESVMSRQKDGFVCTLCEPPSETYPSAEALWVAHDFESLADWLRNTLSGHPHIEFHEREGMTWAALAPSPAAAPVQ